MKNAAMAMVQFDLFGPAELKAHTHASSVPLEKTVNALLHAPLVFHEKAVGK